jgi:hypothetical protein
MPPRKNITALLLLCTAAFGIAPVAGAQDQKKNPAGKIYVTSTNGDTHINNGVRVDSVTEKSTYTAEGTVIETKANSDVSIVLSNGTGICLSGNTRVQIRTFKQEAFRPGRTDMQEEPSVSHTQIFVEYGAIGISTSDLAAGSTMEIDTPDASAALHGGQAVIQVGDNLTEISMVQGSATVSVGPSGDSSVVNSGQQLETHTAGPGHANVVEVLDLPAGKTAGSVQQSLEAMVTTASDATRQVYFNVQTPRAGSTAGSGSTSGSAGARVSAGAPGSATAPGSDSAPAFANASGSAGAPGGSEIDVFDANSTQGATSAPGAAPQIVAVPVVPAIQPFPTNVSPANLTGS